VIDVSPDFTRVYVTNVVSNNVSVIDTATNSVVATINVGASPRQLAVSGDGTRVYVANAGSNSISIIDTATNAVTGTIALAAGSGPHGVALHGTRLYVGDHTLTVSVIDTTSNSVVATIPNGGFFVAVSPDGRRLYGGNQTDGIIAAIDRHRERHDYRHRTYRRRCTCRRRESGWHSRVCGQPGRQHSQRDRHGNQ
jgi:YVTN family beta-propeller protein